MCMSPCTQPMTKKMSFFNDHYVDSSKIFCDNCIIDEEQKNLAYLQKYGAYEPEFNGSYMYWPKQSNPLNGPPYVHNSPQEVS